MLTDFVPQTVDDLVTRRLTQGGGRVVVDGGGAKVGDFAGFDPLFLAPLVSILADGHSYVLRVYPERFGGNPVYFADSNCNGAAYVGSFSFDPANPTNALSMAGLWRNIIYVTDANTDMSLQVRVSSEGLENGTCRNFFVPRT